MAERGNENVNEIHNQFKREMDNHFSSKLSELKHMCEEVLTPKEINNAENVMDIITALNRKDKISPGNYSFLKRIITDKRFIRTCIEPAEEKIQLILSKEQAPLVSSSNPSRNPKDNKYEKTSEQTGYALILNVIADGRKGSKIDVKNLKSFFESELQFIVRDKENLSKENMLQCLKDTRKELTDNANKYYCFVCVVMSHGSKKGVCTVDEMYLTMKELTDFFNNAAFDKFINKPKVFLVQCCRGDTPHPVVEVDEDSIDQITVPKDADLLIAHATTYGDLSVRNTDSGTWFINEVVNVLIKFYKKEHVEEMLVRVRQQVAAFRSKHSDTGTIFCQIPCSWTTLTKLLYL